MSGESIGLRANVILQGTNLVTVGKMMRRKAGTRLR